MTIRNIIFDLGNVLISYQPESFHAERGATRDETLTYIREVYNSPEWQLIDKGVMSVQEAISSIGSRSVLSHAEIALVFDFREELLFPIEKNVALLKTLKKEGFRLYYLSNFPQDMFSLLSRKHHFFSMFDGGVVSSAEKMLKPQPEIYELLLERYSLEKKETIFIDDLLPNILGAESVGLTTIHLTRHDELHGKLAELLPEVVFPQA
ncbi:MAG: HAD family phosphatase [Bacteroidales bacterium]|nr:HAD family phosphatase [Bacteroidales bacterium]